MTRSVIVPSLFATILLLFGVLWAQSAGAASAPIIEPLGQIRDGLSVPTSLDVDSAGNLYVADARQKAVVKFDRYGRKIASFSAATASGGGVAVTSDGSRLYVAVGSAVAVLDGTTGTLLGHLGSAEGEFTRVYDIVIDAQGFVYVADSGALYVRVYDDQGVFQYQFGGPGIAAGQFNMIAALAMDEQAGEIYVADPLTKGTTITPKIQVFDLAGNLLRNLPAPTAFGAPPLAFFAGMTFDRFGRGYFLDSLRNEIRILALPSTNLSTYAVVGYGSGQLVGPSDVVFDPSTDRLFVVCQGGRIEIFGIDGAQNPVKTNVEPGLPVPAHPISGSEATSTRPELVFENAIDPDGDKVAYDVQVFREGQIVDEILGAVEGIGATSVFVSAALEENVEYSWRVRASDGEDVSGWTALQPFYVNAIQEPPSAPILSGPLDGEVLDGEGLLSWQPATDPDPVDTVGYTIELSADPSFAAPAIEEAAVATSINLAGLGDYLTLEVGQSYFWRVKAVDNHGLVSEPSEAGSFVYDTSLFRVTANMPGARVYLYGNHAFYGSYLGEVPTEVRDFVGGPVSVVVARDGFEPYVTQVRVAEGEKVEVYAELAASIEPDGFKARPLSAAGEKLTVSGDAAPFAVDFNSDGAVDLLVGTDEGRLLLYPGLQGEGGQGLELAAGAELALSVLVPQAAPFVADWDNDGSLDLILGGADGAVRLLRGSGSGEAPVFDTVELLMVEGTVLDVGDSSVPAVVDFDGDQAKDLVVGCADGRVLFFRNGGTDEAPQLAAGQLLLQADGPAAPLFSDWDSDGDPELLLAGALPMDVFARNDQGTLEKLKPVVIDSRLDKKQGLKGKKRGGESDADPVQVGSALKLFAYDADGKKGKDMILGNEAGELLLVASSGSAFVPAFREALLDKLAQIDGLIRVSAPELAPVVVDVGVAIESGELDAAALLVKELAVSLAGKTELLKTTDELGKLLQ